MLKDVVDRFYLEFNRDNLIKISEFVRGTFGEDIMAKTMARDVENSPARLVTNWQRPAHGRYKISITPARLCLIEISADIKTRYERVKKRGEKLPMPRRPLNNSRPTISAPRNYLSRKLRATPPNILTTMKLLRIYINSWII